MKLTCLSHQVQITSSLEDLTPRELAAAQEVLRSTLGRLGFREVYLSPFDAYPIDFDGETVDVPNLGQLRFNTEPEIWSSYGTAERFFSISELFRREKVVNPLRRVSFLIVDFYQQGPPAGLLAVFKSILDDLAVSGFSSRLCRLPYREARYDPIADGPILESSETGWVITKGYDSAHSFFEMTDDGRSTRGEIFLVTPAGYLEVGAFGIVGRNANPQYILRCDQEHIPSPPVGLSGMGFGLERLLLAERLLRHRAVLQYEDK